MCMSIFLHGHTAYSYWQRADSIAAEAALENAVGNKMMLDASASPNDVRRLAELFPEMPAPYHLLVCSTKSRRPLDEAVMHTCTQALPRRSYREIADNVYAPCPELCFLQMARRNDLLRLVRAGYRLCARYCVQRDSRDGTTVLRERAPITTPEAITKYLDRAESVHGAILARRASKHVLGNAASPPEIDLAMKLSLPHRLGGFGLPHPVLNKRIELQARVRGIADKQWHEADLLWPDAKLVIEYDSDQFHRESSRFDEDAAKRTTLESMGYRVITVTNAILKNPHSLERVALSASKQLGVRMRFQGRGFEEMQRALFALR